MTGERHGRQEASPGGVGGLVPILAGMALLWAGVYLPGLGGEELKGEEPRRALPGLEMLRTGDWVMPVVGGRDYHRKPPLINWMAAGGVVVVGEATPLAVRWPSVVAVGLFGLATAWAGWRIAGVTAGVLAGVAALTCVGMVDKGRLVEIEGVYVAATGIAFSAWLALAWKQGRPWLGWVLAGAFLGVGFLAKGPPHLVMFYAVAITVAVATRRQALLWHPAHVVGAAVGAGVALPWFLASQRSSGGDGGGVWMDQLTSRLDPASVDWASWVAQIFQGVANFLPWAVLLLLVAVPGSRRCLGVRDDDRLVRGLVWGVVAGYLLIALTPASRGRFTMPLIGPAAILTGVAMARAATPDRLCRIWDGLLRVVAFVLPAVTVAACWVASQRAGAVWSWVALGPVVGVAALIWRAPRPLGMAALAAGTGLCAAALIAVYALAVQPVKALSEEVRPVARRVGHLAGEDQTVIVYKGGYQPWVFYLYGRVHEVASWQDLPDQMTGPMVMKATRFARERKKLLRRYGSPRREERFTSSWDGREMVVVWWASTQIQ